MVRQDSDGEWQADWWANREPGELQRRPLLSSALNTLNERERHIVIERRLTDNPTTLGQLSQQYGISRERVR